MAKFSDKYRSEITHIDVSKKRVVQVTEAVGKRRLLQSGLVVEYYEPNQQFLCNS